MNWTFCLLRDPLFSRSSPCCLRCDGFWFVARAQSGCHISWGKYILLLRRSVARWNTTAVRWINWWMGQADIDIIVTHSNGVIVLILKFHSTVVMNYITITAEIVPSAWILNGLAGGRASRIHTFISKLTSPLEHWWNTRSANAGAKCM